MANPRRGRPGTSSGEIEAIPASDDISPELALVDPELAARLRPALRFGYETPRQDRPAPDPSPSRPEPVAWRRFLAALLGGSALVAAGVMAADELTVEHGSSAPPVPATTAAETRSGGTPTSSAAVQEVVFARLGSLRGAAEFVDPATGLPRTNTAVHCSAVPGRSAAFTCVVQAASGAERTLEVRVGNGVVRIQPG